MRVSNNIEIGTASTFMAMNAHSLKRRGDYVRDVQVFYSGEIATYIAQSLSLGVTSICFGLISNYLYDHLKGKYGAQKDDSVEQKVDEYRCTIEKLNDLLKEGGVKSEKHYQSIYQEHEKILTSIESTDEVRCMVESAIEQLESRAVSDIQEEIDNNFRS